MRIIPVLDIRNGRAVHALAGDRAHYRPLVSVLHEDSEPAALARALRDRLGMTELYVADLDAIAGSAPNVDLLSALGALRLDVWLDAGIRDAYSIEPLREAGVATIVAGLETLRGPLALREVIAAAGAERVVFSLDLRAGQALTAQGADWRAADPRELAARAISLGVRRLLVLDLARVGTSLGTGTHALLAELAQSHRGIELSAGGGVSSLDDVRALGAIGVSAALVGSAIHDGRIGEQALAQLKLHR